MNYGVVDSESWAKKREYKSDPGYLNDQQDSCIMDFIGLNEVK